MNYARALKIIRAVKEISQQELAQKTSLSTSLISRIESGDRTLSKSSLIQISKKLDIPKNLITLLAVEKGDNKTIEGKDAVRVGSILLKIIQDERINTSIENKNA